MQFVYLFTTVTAGALPGSLKEASGLLRLLPDGVCEAATPRGIACSSNDPLGRRSVQSFAANPDQWIGERFADGVQVLALGDEMPGPEQLRRKSMVDGEWVVLGDHREWLVPVLRTNDGITTLPLVQTESGPRPKREHRRIMDEAVAVWEQIEAQRVLGPGATEQAIFDLTGKPPITNERRVRLVREALAVNYRISEPETNLLELFDSDSLERAMWGLLGISAMMRVVDDLAREKKRGQAASAEGAEDGSVGEGPAAGVSAEPGGTESPDLP